MKKGDFLWFVVLSCVVVILIIPGTHLAFVSATKAHPYLMGFLKFALLATMGELLAIRIITGRWEKPSGMMYRVIIWGLFGVMIVLMFEIFSSGVTGAVSKGMLWTGSGLWQTVMVAFWISTIMNLTFAPVFMTCHRITDTIIDSVFSERIPLGKLRMTVVMSKIDWQGFVSFVFLKTIPFFWIPVHTFIFLLPSEYRILVAAMLSVALGVILAYAKRIKISSQISNKHRDTIIGGL